MSPAELPERHAAATQRWVSDGWAGSMGYMTRDGAARANPRKILPEARSVVSLAINYYHTEDARPADGEWGKVAKYAYGRDYHRVIEKKLKKLTAFVRETLGAGVKAYVDTGPILEKAFAQQAGLGFFGKNTNIITRDFGSWVFLASLITDAELFYDRPHEGACGTCRLCIDACPTNALTGDYRMDATRCISYFTIESPGEAQKDVALAKGQGDWVFGCDICQDVCPYNRRAKTTTHEDLSSRRAGTWVDLKQLAAIPDDEAFTKHFEGSPVKRAKRIGLLANAAVISANRSV